MINRLDKQLGEKKLAPDEGIEPSSVVYKEMSDAVEIDKM